MQESYPRSNPWPFVLLGLLLFGLVLAPPKRWPETLREIYTYAGALLPDSQSADLERDGLAVSDELRWPIQKTVQRASVSGTRPATSVAGQDEHRESRLRPQIDVLPAESVVAETADLATRPGQAVTEWSAPRSGGSQRHVWQPPPNWVPQLIQPLRESVQPELSKLTAVPIQQPVANRVARHRILERAARPPRPTEERFDSQAGSLSFAPPTDLEARSADRLAIPEAEIGSLPHDREAAPSMASPSRPDQPTADRWPRSGGLHALLETARADRGLTRWAGEIQETLGKIERCNVTGTSQQRSAITRLGQLAAAEVDASRWPQPRRQLYHRLRFAVVRRVAIWEPLMTIASHQTANLAADQTQLADTVAKLESWLQQSSQTRGWRDYLRLQQLQATAQMPRESRRRIAKQVLSRLRSNQLTTSQQGFVRGPAFQELENDLRKVIASSIYAADLVQSLETYESEPNRSSANGLIESLGRWRAAGRRDQFEPTIAAITSHYRNANLRVAVSQDLINRIVPAVHRYAEEVDENILGADVRGLSSTFTNVSVQLIPDASSLRLGFLASGRVDSSTASRKGPVTMFSQGRSTFAAGKELQVTPSGVFVSETETRASTGHRMVEMQTDLDNIPILAWIVRSMARQQQSEQRPFLRAEILRRVHRGAKQRIDREVEERLASVEQNISQRIVQPLQAMELEPRAMEMRTTKQRVIMRSRLAGPFQFGAHTPRPQARADSLMSLQIHQTAANNTIEQLNLHGQRMTLEDLAATLSQSLGLTLNLPQDEHKDVVVHFAEQRPFEFAFEHGQVTLTIHLAALDTGNRKWENFSVRGYYRADVKQLDIELVREEGIELISDQLRLRDQIALRGIFTKLLAKNSRLEIFRRALQDQPQLSTLAVTQFTIRDGWLALSLGETLASDRFVENRLDDRRSF